MSELEEAERLLSLELDEYINAGGDRDAVVNAITMLIVAVINDRIGGEVE